MTQLLDIITELKKDVPKRMELSQTFIIGKVLLALKNLMHEPRSFLTISKDIEFSRSHAYFLIDFSLLCMKFPKLKTASVCYFEIKTYFSYIKHAARLVTG